MFYTRSLISPRLINLTRSRFAQFATMNSQENVVSMSENRQRKERPSSGKKHNNQNHRHLHNRQWNSKQENMQKWPSSKHRCILFFHDSDDVLMSRIQNAVSPFGTSTGCKRVYLQDKMMSIVEMSSSSEAEAAWKHLSKSKPVGISRVIPSHKEPEIKSCIPYWDEQSVRDGLKDGTLMEGILRINPKSFENAYISDGKNPDVLMDSISARNRALMGDRVAVKLRSPNGGNLDAEGLETDMKKLLVSDQSINDGPQIDVENLKNQKVGDVVAILEKHHPRICVGMLKQVLCKRVLFSPVDNCIPRLLIPLAECPKDFIARPQDFKNKLFMVRIVEWETHSSLASGELCKFIGNSGEIEPETTRILLENNVDDSDFSQTINESLPQDLPWRIPNEEFSKRRDLRSECVFTIDPATARDLDDALHCKKIGDDLFEVGVHIADVSYFVKPKTEIDELAAKRCTSVYLVQRVIPMLPRLLCEELCSLNPGEDRLTYSVIWKLTGKGEIVDEWFGRTVIHSCIKLSYDHAQSFIDSKDDDDLNEKEFPPLDSGYHLFDIRNKVVDLFRISENLRKRRFDDGALRLDQIRLSYTLDQESGMPNSCFTYEYKQSNKLIEEFMLLANIAVAHKLHNSLPNHAFLRCHPEPKEDMLKSIASHCQSNGLNLDTSSAGALAASVQDAAGHDELAEYRLLGLQMLAIKPQEMAMYLCSGTVDDHEKYRHYALNVPLYTHFTSPIRRYADVIVHRQLSAALGDKRDMELASLTATELQKQADNCNQRKLTSRHVQDLSVQLFFYELVKAVGALESDAVVLYVYDHAFDILSIKYGQVYRVYTDNLPLVGFKQTKNETELELLWPCDGTERYKLSDQEINMAKNGKLKMPKYTNTEIQTIKFFSVVQAVFEVGHQHLQVKAYIRRTADKTIPNQ